jgi:hypothetical protein
LPIGSLQHRVDVRKFAAARARQLHALAIAPEADLFHHSQRTMVVDESAAIDCVMKPNGEDTSDQRP